jgi:Family of unknown function (DUF5309)
MSGVAGLRGTGDWSTDERPKDFRGMIQMLNPQGLSPIFGLTSKAGKKSVSDPEFKFWVESQGHVRLQVNGALASGDTTVVVDSADPTATTMTVQYGTATNLKPGDLLMVEPSSDSTTYAPEILRVTNVASDTTFTVSRGAAGSSAASISDDAFLTLMGSAYAEGSGAPRAVSRNPVQFFNYTQIFKEAYEITGTADKTTARTGSAWSNDKKRKQFDHARAIEMAFIFGRRSETAVSDENGKPMRTMGGLLEIIPTSRKTVFTGDVTFEPGPNNFLDAVYKVFDYGSPAGDTRACFCGNSALNALQNAAAGSTNVRMNSDKVIKVYGTDFREFILPQGRLLLRTHPLLNIIGGIYAKSMLILDFSAIKYVYMNGRDTKVKDDIQLPGEDGRRGMIQTECSLMLDYGGVTCAYLGNIVQNS